MKKIAIVTGGTGGIGSAICKELGTNGYKVIVNGIDDVAASKLMDELHELNVEAEYLHFDVTNEDEVNKNVKYVGEKYGHIDALINNAGGLGGRSRFETMTTEFYRNVLALNLDSAFYMSRACIPYLKKGELKFYLKAHFHQ